jgi:hypothetical protein
MDRQHDVQPPVDFEALHYARSSAGSANTTITMEKQQICWLSQVRQSQRGGQSSLVLMPEDEFRHKEIEVKLQFTTLPMEVKFHLAALPVEIKLHKNLQ